MRITFYCAFFSSFPPLCVVFYPSNMTMQMFSSSWETKSLRFSSQTILYSRRIPDSRNKTLRPDFYSMRIEALNIKVLTPATACKKFSFFENCWQLHPNQPRLVEHKNLHAFCFARISRSFELVNKFLMFSNFKKKSDSIVLRRRFREVEIKFKGFRRMLVIKIVDISAIWFDKAEMCCPLLKLAARLSQDEVSHSNRHLLFSKISTMKAILMYKFDAREPCWLTFHVLSR